MKNLYFFLITSLSGIFAAAQVNHLVISQVYGSGGLANATYNADFIEIFNPTSLPVSLSTYSVQYAVAQSTSGSFTVVTTLSGTLQPGQFYLIRANNPGATGAALTADATPSNPTNISSAAGKVVLVNSTAAIAIGSNGCATTTPVDLLGYGSGATTGANCYETAPATGTSSNANSKIRTNVCADSDNNSAEFSTSAVTPRSTTSPLNQCGTDLNVNQLVISQVYGGGGLTGATYRNDFIEIFNRSSDNSINLRNLSVQYAGATSTNWAKFNLPNITLQPGQYFLIQGESGGAVGANLPAPDADASSVINLAAAAGKVALVASTTELDGTNCPTGASVIDIVGYGSSTTCFEGAGPAPSLSNTQSALRNRNGCTDINNNATDFDDVTPNPKNTASALNQCPAEIPLPIHFINVKATKKSSGIEVSFSNLTESDVVNYTIERSANGQQYNTVTQLIPAKNNGGRADYRFTDIQPSNSMNYYRIKAVETAGKIMYSPAVKMHIGTLSSGITIYPNPVKGRQLSCQANNLAAGTYKLMVRNAAGQVIAAQDLRHEGGTTGQTVPLHTSKPGVYYLEIRGSEKLRIAFVIQ